MSKDFCDTSLKADIFSSIFVKHLQYTEQWQTEVGLLFSFFLGGGGWLKLHIEAHKIVSVISLCPIFPMLTPSSQSCAGPVMTQGCLSLVSDIYSLLD